MTEFFELNTPKNLDIISDLRFSPLTQNHAIVSTWSNQILLYDCTGVLQNPESPPSTDPIHEFKTEETPLCMVYTGPNSAFAGFLDGSIRQIDFENIKINSQENLAADTTDEEIGNGINNLAVVKNQENLIASTSFSGKLQLIDTRQRKPILVNQSQDNPHRKIFTMDTSRDYLTLGLNANHIEIYDYRNLKVPFEKREVGLKYQIKDLKCFPDNEGFALSTIDGRVSIEYFDSSPEVQE